MSLKQRYRAILCLLLCYAGGMSSDRKVTGNNGMSDKNNYHAQFEAGSKSREGQMKTNSDRDELKKIKGGLVWL